MKRNRYKQITDKRLIEVPQAFIDKTTLLMPDFYEKLLMAMSEMDISNGKFAQTEYNYNKALEIKSQLQQMYMDKDYVKALRDFALQFDEQKNIDNQFFEGLLNSPFDTKEIYDIAFNNAKRTALSQLTDVPVPVKAELTNILDSVITTNGKFTDAIKSVRQIILGTKEVDSQLVSYSKGIAYDGYAITHRTYMQSIITDLGFEFYEYSGGEIKTTRCFCEQRHGKVYHIKEIQGWGDGKGVGDCGYPWAGMRKGTNASTIFTYVGGYNCQHDLLPLSRKQVSDEDIKRAIKLKFIEQ